MINILNIHACAIYCTWLVLIIRIKYCTTKYFFSSFIMDLLKNSHIHRTQPKFFMQIRLFSMITYKIQFKILWFFRVSDIALYTLRMFFFFITDRLQQTEETEQEDNCYLLFPDCTQCLQDTSCERQNY